MQKAKPDIKKSLLEENNSDHVFRKCDEEWRVSFLPKTASPFLFYYIFGSFRFSRRSVQEDSPVGCLTTLVILGIQ